MKKASPKNAVVSYALIARNEQGSRVGILGTRNEPRTEQGKINSAFHALCSSMLTLHPEAWSVETISWRPGVKVEDAPVLLTAQRVESGSSCLLYRFPETDEEVEYELV